MTSATFQSYFRTLPSNETANSNAKAFLDATNVKSSKEELEKFVSQDDVVLLVSMRGGKVRFIHSAKVIGNQLHRPTDSRLIALVGMNSRAMVIELDKESLFKNQQFKHPEIEYLEECSSKEEFLELADDDSNYCETIGMGYKIATPFIFEEAFSVDSNNPNALDIIRPILKRGEEIDEVLDNNHASTLAKDVARWLYAVGTNKIGEVNYEIHPDDTELEDYSKRRHEQCVLPPPESQNTVMRGSDQALVATLSRQIEVVERQSDILSAHFQRAVEKEEAKSNKFAKLPNSVQNMIRMASSTDGERPSDPSGVSLDFYNAESEGRADTIFMQAMRDLSSGTVAVSQAVTSALYHGFFLYNNGMTPSNLSVFNFTLQTPGTSDATRGEVVHLIATQGKRKTENEIKASMQQCIKIPADFDGMMRQIRFFKDAAIILLGKNSKLADELGRLLKSIGREEQTFRLRIHGDEMYISKFLYAIDVRCQRHLSECRDARDREEDVRD
jgi:hypothetical protein